MALRQMTGFLCRGLTFWLALCMAEGKDAGLLPGEENRDIIGELTETDEWIVDSGLPTECSPRKLTKRSSPVDASWFRSLDSRETNCQIFSVTTAPPQISLSRVSTEDPRKATTRRIKAASPEEEPRLLYFMPYYPLRQHAFYNVLFRMNGGARGYNTIWYYKSLGEDSSEETRRKRDTFPISKKRSKIPLEK